MANEYTDMIQSAMKRPSVSSGHAYFLGGQGLIKFSDGEDDYGPATFWLVDKNNRTVRPFESEAAMQNAFGEGLETAKKNCVPIASPKVSSNGDIVDGVLKGFSLLTPEYAIKEDGSAQEVEFSSHQLKKRYGKPVNQQAEEKAVTMLDNFLGSLKGGQDGITPSSIEKLQRNELLMAHFVSALAYGGYAISDIKQEIMRRTKAK